MALTRLDLFKKHVRADDFETDDELLQFYLDTAERHVIGMTNRKVEDLTKKAEEGEELPKQLQQATLMLAAHWYNQRESVSGVQMYGVPDSLSTLVKPFVRLV